MPYRSVDVVEGGTVVCATAIFVDLTMTSAGIPTGVSLARFGDLGVALCMTMCGGKYVVKSNGTIIEPVLRFSI
jgi:hypothetical protein